MKHQRAFLASPFSFLWFFLLLTLSFYGKVSSSDNSAKDESPVMGKSEWRTITSTEYGEVSAIDVKDGHRLPFHLQFFKLEPNSLFLPVLLHADMLFYVHTGSGRLIWAYDGNSKTINLRQGDICMLGAGFVFYLQSNLEAQRQRLRIFAIFPNSIHNHYDPAIGAYSRISELVGGFDQKIMQAAFGVPEELAAEISEKTKTPAIVHAVSKEKNNILKLEAWILNGVFGGETAIDVSSNNNKPGKYNVFDKQPDFKNRYGWSLMVTQKHLKSLKHINIGFLMVNLTAVSGST
ncbi:vicilin-like seed storage protein At2g18540 [Neltuma alba]|uniref:vicilin-like seed storage protein At2g18540 n=1 Tax=Neltuma alba TaxID=207710 RepID=UPI0010A34005|nr:vicilin-like seed storage protein At2g18540 [Prosopis alba]